MLFFFASLLEAIIVIVHIVWLDPAYLSRTFEQTLALVESMSADQNMISKLKQQPIPTPFSYTLGMIMGNLLIGFFLSLFLVPLANRFTFKNDNRQLEE